MANGRAAFQLHRRNYDVWLANLRGVSPYGRHHLELTDVMTQFWRYSFHEHGAYDLPAIIDHIVEVKQAEQQGQAGEGKQEGELEEEQVQKEEEHEHSEEQTPSEGQEPNVEQEQPEEREQTEEQGQPEERARPEKQVEMQPEQEATRGGAQKEMHQVLLIGHSQVCSQMGGVALVKLMLIFRVYLRPLMPSWCSVHCIRDSINASC